MLGLAGIPLGHTFTFLDPNESAGARAVGDLIVAGYGDRHSLGELASVSDVITFEFENASADALTSVAGKVDVFPSIDALAQTQDRANEKQLFERCGISAPVYALASTAQEIPRAVDNIGCPCVVKTRREGYDGKGQAVVRSNADIDAAVATVGDRPSIVERLIPFERELSIVAVRSRVGDVRCYPLIENVHHEGILRLSRAPASAPGDLQSRAEEAVARLLADLGHVGVLTLEMFEHDGELIANEIAPRVHNSGHWTIEGADTSQFENHIRAVTGAALGATTPTGYSAMVNLIGAVPEPDAILGVAGAHLHLYDKTPQPGRKVGHVTIRGDQLVDVERSLRALRGLPGTYLEGPDAS
jgi:5-(carboxyamino)imidazole ribonucleotide synthase